MSVKVMSLVWERYPGKDGELNLALALADHAHDDGTRIFPGIPALMKKTRQSERAVQNQLARMKKMGWLRVVSESKGGKGNFTEYRIDPDWLNGAISAPLATVHLATPNGAFGDTNGAFGDTHICKPSRTIIEPSDAREEVSTEGDSQVAIAWDQVQGIFINISPEQYKRWEEAFPKLDIDTTLTRIELWYQQNPTKRKRYLLRFITGWMSRDFAKLIQPRSFSRSPPSPIAGAPP